MMRWTFLAPPRHKGSGIKGKTNAAIRVADAKRWSREAFAFRHQELKFVIDALRHAKNGDWPELDLKLY